MLVENKNILSFSRPPSSGGRLSRVEENKLLVYAARVNRIGQLEPGGFDEEKMLPEVQETLTWLDGVVPLSKSVNISCNIEKKKQSLFTALTDRGQVTIKQEEEQDKADLDRIEKEGGFRIGQYVVYKHKEGSGKDFSLFFYNFWGLGGANEALEIDPPYIVILYHHQGAIVVDNISRYVPHPKVYYFSRICFKLLEIEIQEIWKRRVNPKPS